MKKREKKQQKCQTIDQVTIHQFEACKRKLKPIDWREEKCLQVKVDKKVFRWFLRARKKDWTWEQIIGQIIIIRRGLEWDGKWSGPVTRDEYK